MNNFIRATLCSLLLCSFAKHALATERSSLTIDELCNQLRAQQLRRPAIQVSSEKAAGAMPQTILSRRDIRRLREERERQRVQTPMTEESSVTISPTIEDDFAAKRTQAKQRLFAQKAVRKAARDAYYAKRAAYRAKRAEMEKLRKRYAAISKHHMRDQGHLVLNDVGVSRTRQEAPNTDKRLYQRLKELNLLLPHTDSAAASSSPTDAAEILDDDGVSTGVVSEFPKLAPKFTQLKKTIHRLNKSATARLSESAKQTLLAQRNYAFWKNAENLISTFDIIDAKEMASIKQMVDQAKHAARINKINTKIIGNFPDINKALDEILNPEGQ